MATLAVQLDPGETPIEMEPNRKVSVGVNDAACRWVPDVLKPPDVEYWPLGGRLP